MSAEQIKPGYKRTEVGVIPEDWVSVAAGLIGRFRGGSGFPLKYQGGHSGVHPFFKVSDMNNEGNETFMRTANNYISDATRKAIGANLFSTNSIVFAKVGAAVYLERKKILSRESCLDNNMAAYELDESKADYRFIYFRFLNTKFGDLVSTTALPSLSGRVLSEIRFPLPPVLEQRAIATALADVDALLAKLDQLITKKRYLKQAAMQQLLTGQTRLPGFSGKWEPKRLGQLGAFLKGSGVKRDQALSGDLPCIRYGEIYTVHSDVVRIFHSRISPQVAASATRIQIGDLLFAGSGETKAEIGKCVAIASPVEAYAGGDIVILRLRIGDPTFFGYLLNTPAAVRQKASLGQGDAVVHISAPALANVEMPVPTAEEQAAIAAVLSDLDAELAALEVRRDKTRAIKQGMMQELLTGRIRIV